MTVDTVDDLHDAEDLIGLLTAALDAVTQVDVEQDGWWNDPAWATAATALAAGRTYCRPSCEYDEQYECDDDCGCPCGHPHDPERANST